MDKDNSGERSREHLFHLRHLSITVLIFTFTFSHLADAFIQSDLQLGVHKAKFVFIIEEYSEMFVYYKLYRKPVYPTISTPRCGITVPAIEGVHEKARSVRLFFIFRTNVLPLCWPIDRSYYNLNKLFISTRLRWRILSISYIETNNI